MSKTKDDEYGDVKCGHCMNLGKEGKEVRHPVADCPVIARTTCNVCGVVGHLSSRCPRGTTPSPVGDREEGYFTPPPMRQSQGNPPRLHAQAPAASRPEGHTVCRFCKGIGHNKSNCAKLAGITCGKCGMQGHTTNYCQRRSGQPSAPSHQGFQPPLTTVGQLTVHEVDRLRALLVWAETRGFRKAADSYVKNSYFSPPEAYGASRDPKYEEGRGGGNQYSTQYANYGGYQSAGTSYGGHMGEDASLKEAQCYSQEPPRSRWGSIPDDPMDGS